MGQKSEENLWKAGVHTWTDFIQRELVPGINPARKPLFDIQLREAEKQLFAGNSEYFTVLPSNEQWRAWEEFGEEAAYIDIETNHQNNITVLGISDGVRTWQFVRHHNMNQEDIREVLKQFKLLVTFNGACFDLPIIRRYFTHVLPDVPHIDLRFVGQKIGLRGGLKHIEKSIGISRGENVEDVRGSDALILWSQYRRTGNTQFRDILLEYNAEDILNLKPLAEYMYAKIKAEKTKYIKTSTV